MKRYVKLFLLMKLLVALGYAPVVLALTCTSTAAVNNWNVVATWSGGVGNCNRVPINGDDVIISAGGTTTLNVNSNTLASLTINGTLIIGANLNVNNTAASALTINGTGTVTIGNSAAARAMVVTGNITVAGTFAVGATAATHTLTAGGNITNAGTINFLPGAGRICNVTFNKNGNQTVSGAGAYTFNLITLNMGATNANVLDMQSTMTVPSPFLTITNGTYKHSNTTNITPWTTGAGATIPATGGFWLNSTATVTTTGFNVTINGGLFRISNGTMTIGNTNTTVLVLGNFASTLFQMDGGTLTVTGGINSATNASAGTFTMNGGTINLMTISAGAVYSLLLGSGTTLNWSNGTIIAFVGNNAVDDIDIRSATQNVTGGTLQMGSGPSSGNQISMINSAGGTLTVGSLVINQSNANTILMRSSTNVLNNLTINALNTLAPSAGLAINIGAGNVSGNWTNNGAFTQGTSVVTLLGTAASTIGGTTATTFYQLNINKTVAALASRTVTLGINATITNGLTLTNGMIDAATFTVIIPAGGTVTRGAGCSADGSVNGCFVIGNLQKNFAVSAAAQTRTFEVGSVATGVAYAPVSVTLATVTTAGNFVVSGTAGDHPQLGTSTLDPAKSANRYWTLTNAGIVFSALAGNTLVFNFVAADVDAGANPLNFNVGRYNAPVWTVTPPPTPTRTATSTTIAGVTITNASIAGAYAVAETFIAVPPPGSFNAFETSTAAGAITGKIYTKLVGTAFSLDVVAILAGVQQVAFTNSVTVELLANTTGAGLDAQNCPTAFTVIQGPATANIVGGRSTVNFTAVATAYRDMRVRVRFPVLLPTVTSCSTDDFAIRPISFSSVTSNMTNALSTGAPVARAGAAFTLTAIAGAGYDGTPAIDATKVTAHAGAVQVGAIGGVFGAAASGSGTATGNTFTYSEVGNFTLGVDAVFDSGFTSLDSAGGDCTNDFSNALVGGKYGCNFGNDASYGPFGRFTPDHFDVALNAPVFAPACTGFTYVGQAFNYTTAPVITVTARNSAALGNLTTRNYTGASWWKLSNASLTYPAAVTATRGYAAFTGTLDITGLPATDPIVVDTGGASSGTGTLTFGSGTGVRFTRTAPVAPFNADIGLSINVIDSDAIAFATNPAAFGAATAGNGITFSDGNALTLNDKDVRFGRLRLQNAYGSELLALPVSMRAEYWNGFGFVANTNDNCTTINLNNVAIGNPQGAVTAALVTPLTGGGTLNAGAGTLRLRAPGSGNQGSVDVSVNLTAGTAGASCTPGMPASTQSNLTHLQGLWCTPPGTYVSDPTARATFGTYRNADKFIYQRENF